jgi:peptide/nickel transport system permease protein
MRSRPETADRARSMGKTIDDVALQPPPTRGARLRTVLRRNPLITVGAALSLFIVVVAVFAPLLAPYPADAVNAVHPTATLRPPSGRHLFGTDQLGRDVLSRVLYGARVSPAIAVLVLLSACVIGIPLGVAAGYFGGLIDDVIMRITDVFLAFPALLLALAFAAVLTPSVGNTTLAIAITWWPWYTRLIRGQAASVAGRQYVEGARALGVPHRRILFRHVLPNSITPLIVQVSLDVGGVILTASALSFLGLGAQDPTPDWGLMVNQGQAYFTTQWWLVTFPGLAILLTAVGFNLLGDGLRDVLDPKRVIAR